MARKKTQPTNIIHSEFSVLINGGDLRAGTDYTEQIADAKRGLVGIQELIGRMQNAQSRITGSSNVTNIRTTRSRKATTPVTPVMSVPSESTANAGVVEQQAQSAQA